MEKKIFRKKLLAILMIISIVAADFFILSSNLITYADQISSETNNENVEFLAYFKNKDGKVVDSIEKSIKDQELKLYAQIIVHDGYVNDGTLIEINDSNFNLKNNILSPFIHKIDGNKVTLKQIDKGETEIALDIEPIRPDKMAVDMLSKISIVKLNGSYTGTTSGGIQYGKEVCISFNVDESATAELKVDIITNKVFKIDGTNKKIVQLLIKSRLADNQYPTEKTTLKVSVPELSGTNLESVDVIAINKFTQISNFKNQDGIVEIVIENKADKNGEISWNKNTYDEVVVTFLYDKNVDTSNLVLTTNSEIKVYNSETTFSAGPIESSSNTELNNTILAIPHITTEEMYKGNLYAQKDLQYNTNTTLVITNKQINEEIVINEGTDKFILTDESKVTADTKYISTEINANKALEIIGAEGSIIITNGDETTNINKTYIDSYITTNNSENIVIQHGENLTNELEIKVLKPAKTGLLEIKHTKAITGRYSGNQITTIKSIKTLTSVQGTSSEAKPTEASAEIKNTISKVDLKIENSKQILTSTEENELILGITLNTEGQQYNLYKNPKITLQMPEAVEKLSLNGIQKFYDDLCEFGEPSVKITDKVVEITLSGEQEAYPKTSLYLQLKLNVTLSRLAPSKTDKITMIYTNQKISQYTRNTIDTGTVEQTIEISGQPGLVKVFNLSSNEDISTTHPIKQQVIAGEKESFEIALVNNTESDMSNVRILGHLPTETTLWKEITASSGTIYYTENANATIDTENTENGWTTSFSANAKLYLIKFDSLNKEASFTATVNLQIPSTLENGLESNTKYEVIYNTESQTDIKETSRIIVLTTNEVPDIEVKLTAQVGQQRLNNGDKVKEGEVIRYIVTAINNTSETIENIELKVGAPEGTVIVRPVELYEYLFNSYYEEKIDMEELSTTITALQAGETYTAQYEVRVNTDITSDTEISNIVTAIYNGTETQSPELTHKLEESNIRVIMKKAIDKSIKLTAGSEVQYDVIIENLSNEAVNGLGIEIISDNFIQEGEEISLGQIPANGTINLKLKGKIKDDVKEMQISANITDSTNTYRSNVVTEELLQADATINLTSSKNNSYLKENDIVDYKITVLNTGNISEYFKVYYSVPDILDVQTVNIKTPTGTYPSLISNLIYEGINLEPGQSATINVTAKVQSVEETKIITNQASVEVLNAYKDVSEKITHTLLSGEIIEEDTKNIISGSAWTDVNVNGQKDSEETILQGITVKLYDISTNSYLVDEAGIVTAKTNANGEYTFTKIPNGSYIVVFEYDTEKYELTTYMAEGVDTAVNSKAILKNITVNDEIITVAGIGAIDVQENIGYMNIGLKPKTNNPPAEDTKRTITGHAWLDSNSNGKKDDGEKAIAGVKVKVYDISIRDYLKDANGNIIETTTNSNGEYYLINIEKGSYILIFEYDTEKYELTTYLPESKVILNKMNINGNEIEVASTEIIELQDNARNINIGLKEIQSADEGQGGPGDGEQGDDGQDGEDKKVQLISGYAWLDADRDGQKDVDEKVLSGIKVRLSDATNGNIAETTTDANGKYIFNDVEKGSYILIFEYDTNEYEPTVYLAEGVDETLNSKVILKKININGQEITAAVTDTIDVQTNIFNMNIGLKEKLTHDLELNKYISRVVVQTSKETKAYDYKNTTFEKVEIHKKQIQGSLVVLEYTIKVKNNGEITGYAKNIVDYLPNGLTFSSELNKDWYLSGDYLYTKSLENVEIKPGEEKEIKLILTKTMTTENVGLINNRAEIYQDYNKYGELDIDSTPNNQVQGEDDIGSADIIIGISTGGSIILYTILIMANIALIGVAIVLMIKNGVIKIPTKEERR